MNFTEVEAAIIEWFKRNLPDAALRRQLEQAEPTKREFTPSGFFTSVWSAAPASEDLSGLTAYSECGLFSPQLEIYAACILHTNNGRIASLEVYAHGDGDPASVKDFQVRPVEENFIDLRGINHDA